MDYANYFKLKQDTSDYFKKKIELFSKLEDDYFTGFSSLELKLHQLDVKSEDLPFLMWLYSRARLLEEFKLSTSYFKDFSLEEKRIFVESNINIDQKTIKGSLVKKYLVSFGIAKTTARDMKYSVALDRLKEYLISLELDVTKNVIEELFDVMLNQVMKHEFSISEYILMTVKLGSYDVDNGYLEMFKKYLIYKHEQKALWKTGKKEMLVRKAILHSTYEYLNYLIPKVRRKVISEVFSVVSKDSDSERKEVDRIIKIGSLPALSIFWETLTRVSKMTPEYFRKYIHYCELVNGFRMLQEEVTLDDGIIKRLVDSQAPVYTLDLNQSIFESSIEYSREFAILLHSRIIKFLEKPYIKDELWIESVLPKSLIFDSSI